MSFSFIPEFHTNYRLHTDAVLELRDSSHETVGLHSALCLRASEVFHLSTTTFS
jgi:hypothetical protein